MRDRREAAHPSAGLKPGVPAAEMQLSKTGASKTMGHAERRNLYRVLHVQPEAPLEVIKASYRALMSTLRVHPDLGGDHAAAAQLNAAYAILGDPERRAAYDRSLRRPARGAAAPQAARTVRDPNRWREEHSCPMCGVTFARLVGREPRCTGCDSPLTPAPSSGLAEAELLGRRHGERYARVQDAQLRLSAQDTAQGVRLKDLSLTGLSLQCRSPMPPGTPFRITAAGFDAVAVVIAQRRQGDAHAVHARLLTLQVLRSPAGHFVSTRA